MERSLSSPDPRDIGREYEKDVIRINSQSGKGGVGYILESAYALNLPARLKEAFAKVVKSVSVRSIRN